MTTVLTTSGFNALFGSDVDVVNDELLAALINLDEYTFNASHSSLADVPQVAVVAESLLSGKSLVGATFEAAPTVFPSVSAEVGVTVTALGVFKNAEAYADCTLLFFSDESPEFPATPDGEDITITWGEGSNKIFEGLSV